MSLSMTHLYIKEEDKKIVFYLLFEFFYFLRQCFLNFSMRDEREIFFVCYRDILCLGYGV